MKFALFVPVFALWLPVLALDLPMAITSAPDGRFLVLNTGAKASLSVMDGTRELASVALEDAWLGLVTKGNTIYAGGGATGAVHEFSYTNGEAKLLRSIKAGDFIGDVALSPDGRLIYAADLFANQIVVINPQSGRVIDRLKCGRRPYRILFHPDGKSYFVSSWADASVYQYSTVNGEEVGRVRLGPHPTDMVLSNYKPAVEEGRPAPDWQYRLFVAAANTNSVYSVAISESKTMKLLEPISIAPTSLTPLGMTPSALLLSRDQNKLYVACSDADAIAVINLSEERSILEGYLEPGAEYPTAVLMRGQNELYAVGAGSAVLGKVPALEPEPWSEEPAARASAANPSAKPERVVYIITNGKPEDMMLAMAGTVPDFTVKLSRRKQFSISDPGNTPHAGYLWTNALAAGLTVRNHGVFVSGGKAFDPALASHTNLDFKGTATSFIEDWKQLESANRLPRLTLVQLNDASAVAAVIEGIRQSRAGSATAIFVGAEALHSVETALGLRSMTRQDAALPPVPSR